MVWLGEREEKVVYFGILAVVLARPEPPRGRFFIPPQLSRQQALPQETYGAPSAEPAQEYGPPDTYGPPAQTYGPPPPQKIISKNIYIHVPPEEPAEIQPSQRIEVPTQKKHYKVIFIKAPTPPAPTAPVIPAQIQDEHKTLVYVLVKKPESQPQVVVPPVVPTEPSKPEVYFIKYKQDPTPASQYGPPASQYGAPPSF
ncbi:extensin [Sergentomyia squamirostris]